MKQTTITTGRHVHRRTAARTAAAVLVIAILGLIVAFVRPMERTSAIAGAANDDPEALCYRMLTAEKSGDVPAFLDGFVGELQQQLKEQFLSKGPAARSMELRDRSVDLTGLATSDLQFPDSDRAVLVLERIFTGHSDRHQIEFSLTDAGWRIVSLHDLGRIESRVPYGTPVSGQNSDER